MTSSCLVRRNLLTEAYACNDNWDKYLTSDTMKKINTSMSPKKRYMDH